MTISASHRRLMARYALAPALIGGKVAVSGVRAGIRATQEFPPLADLPAGSLVELPDRGRTFVIDTGSPRPGAPTLLLLHGLVTTAYLTWFGVLDELARDYRVITFDQRWHGRGIVSDRFSLEDCVDDAAAVLDHCGVEQATVVGYSMGGALAQLFWRRHPSRTAGLVLCSTAMTWQGNLGDRMFFPMLSRFNDHFSVRHHDRVTTHAAALPELPHRSRDRSRFAWQEFRSTSAWAVPEVLGALGRFDATSWMRDVDVPTAVVVTARDRAIPTPRQRTMAATIPNALVYEAPGGHTSVSFDHEHWNPVFFEAVGEVTRLAAPVRA